MAKATATCTCATCGATFTRTAIKYNRREADEWESWATRTYTECTTCWQARKDKERAEENAKAAEAAKASGLPELTGSPKQIAWATTIRQKAIDAINTDCSAVEKEIEHLKSDMHISPKDIVHKQDIIHAREAELQLVREVSAQMISERTSSSWWIDHRDGAYLLDMRERILAANAGA